MPGTDLGDGLELCPQIAVLGQPLGELGTHRPLHQLRQHPVRALHRALGRVVQLRAGRLEMRV